MVPKSYSAKKIKDLCASALDELKAHKIKILGTEGSESNEWILIDAGDVLVNIMTEDSRDHYDLESLWNRSRK